MNHETPILFEEIPGKNGNIGLVTLNRPKALNAMTTAMCKILYDQLAQWEKDSQIKAVIIRGNGERAFCAGGDIRHFYETGHADIEKSLEFFWHEYRLNHRIFHFPKPYIALMHGIVMGGGAGVSIHGSHRVAAENLLFAMPETSIGLYPDIGASYFLTRCVDKTGFYLGLTGAKIHAADAHYVGLVDAIVPLSQFEELITAIAATGFSVDANASVSKIIHSFSIPASSPHLLIHRAVIDRCFSLSTVEEILSALRAEKISWAEHAANELLTRSPTSLKVTLKQLQQSALLSLDDCLQMDFRLTAHFLEAHDFYEGIRAAIIDKDRSPKWQPAKLSEVSESDLAEYFAPLERELSFI